MLFLCLNLEHELFDPLLVVLFSIEHLYLSAVRLLDGDGNTLPLRIGSILTVQLDALFEFSSSKFELFDHVQCFAIVGDYTHIKDVLVRVLKDGTIF